MSSQNKQSFALTRCFHIPHHHSVVETTADNPPPQALAFMMFVSFAFGDVVVGLLTLTLSTGLNYQNQGTEL
eukprot:3741200-Amphidinium_carterae.1